MTWNLQVEFLYLYSLAVSLIVIRFEYFSHKAHFSQPQVQRQRQICYAEKTRSPAVFSHLSQDKW